MNILSIILLWLAAFTGGRDGVITTEVPDSKTNHQIDAQSSTLAGPTTVIALEDTHFRPAK